MIEPDDPREIPAQGPEDRPSSRGEVDDEGRAEADEGDESAVATEEIREEIEEELAEVERLRDRLLRLQAEFDNFRKREARERAAAWARAKGDLLQKLLGSLDDLDRVANLDPHSASAETIIDGVRLVERKLMDMLAREGLVTVGEVGEPFDPNVHDAIGVLPAPSPEQQGRVAAVAVRGYCFGNQLVRPAQVQVYESGAGGSTPGH
jgi:molecular chaperone GrpE